MPHNDYDVTSNVKIGHEKTIIFPITPAGTFLTCWIKEENGNLTPIILWISFPLVFIFNKDLVHGGGLGPAESIDDYLKNIGLGCPRVHMYLVRDHKNIPDDFVCHGHPDHDGDSYNKYYKTPNPTDALQICQQRYQEIIQEVEEDEKKPSSNKRSGPASDFVQPQAIKTKCFYHFGDTKIRYFS